MYVCMYIYTYIHIWANDLLEASALTEAVQLLLPLLHLPNLRPPLVFLQHLQSWYRVQNV